MKTLSILCALGLSLLLATGCQRPEEPTPPPRLLPKEEMVSLLVQLHLLEARIETARMSPDSARALFLGEQRKLLVQRHIPVADSTFEHSYRYYATHSKDLDEIYTAVTDSLTAIEKRLGGTPTSFHH